MAVKKTILKVGHTDNSSQDVFIPNPSSIKWGIQSVSSSSAGRTINGTMQVGLVTRKRKLELAWKTVDFASTAEILQAFAPEKFYVQYRDAQTNTTLRKKFYVGDRTAMVHSYASGLQYYTDISFNIIEV